MATNNVRVGIELSDNGSIDRLTQDVRRFRDLLKQVEAAAANINVGGTAGSRRAAAAAAATPTPPPLPGGTAGSRGVAAAARPGVVAAAEVADYGRMRGAAGATGASARDFANQAQGLGGLVRLYATFAANIFAVSAAFGALREAMNTTNMVKGLDMLGAASGQNLGTLSKRLVEVTGGALSMRDAMESVAKATSSGMGQKDLERLTMVAKNASGVLGLNLPDAMSRLTRAVTKLEPELLDELGIMTRIEPAVEAYARQTGRAASSLSQMERQQAFLNAVLAEGEEKFGALGATLTNPYDKLLAALKNTLQTGLEYVNKVLGPIVDLLASSPTGLALALGALSIALVRQALPALTQFKAGLQRTTDQARNLAVQRAQDAADATAKINQMSLRDLSARADAEIARVDAAEKKIQELKQGTLNKNTAAYKLLQKTAQEVTDAELAAVRKRADIAERRGLTQQAAAYREVADAQEASRAAEAAYAKKEQEVREQQKQGLFYQQTQTAALKAQEAATKSAIVSNAAYNTGLIGLSNSWRLMNEQINQSGLQLTGFQRAALQARAGLAILGGAVAALGTALNAALGWIGLIIAAVGIVDSVFSKGSKQISDFNSAIDGLESNAEATTRTIERLNNTSGSGTTIQGITAISNSLRELSDSAEDSIQKIKRAQASMGAWDKLKDIIASGFGGGLQNTLADAIGKSIEQAVAAAAKLGVSDQVKQEFAQILGTTDFTAESAAKAFKALKDEPSQQKVLDILKRLSGQATESSNRLTTFKSAVDATTKSYQEFIQRTAVSDPLFTLGNNLEDVAISMANLQNKGIKELDAALLAFAKDPSRAQLFGPEFVKGFISIREEFESTTLSIKTYSERLEQINTRIEQIKKGAVKAPLTAEEIKELSQLQLESKRLTEVILEIPTDSIEEARSLFSRGIESAFERSAKLVSQALGNASEKARLTLQKAELKFLPEPARVEEEIRLQREDINIRLRAIDTNIDLILSQEKLSATIAEANALQAQRQAKTPEEKQQAEDRVLVASLTRQVLEQATQGGQEIEAIRQAVLRQELNKGPITTTVENQVRANLLGPTRQQAGQQAARIGVKAELEVLNLDAALRIQKARTAEEEKLIRLQQESEQARIDELNTLTSITGQTSLGAIGQRITYDNLVLTNKIQQENNRLAEREAEIALISDEAKRREAETGFKAQKSAILTRQDSDKFNQSLKNRQALLNYDLQVLQRQFEVQQARLGLENNLAQLQFEVVQEQAQAYTSLYGSVQSFAILQQDNLAREQARLQLVRGISEAETALNQKREEANRRIAAIPQTVSISDRADQIAEINRELARQTELTRLTTTGLQAQYNQRLQILDITKQVSLEQERYNALLQSSTGIAESLKGIFDGAADSVKNLADALGTLVTKTTEYGITSEKNQKALLQADDAIIKKKAEIRAIEQSGDDATPQIKALEKLEEARGNQIKKNTRDEITGAAQIAGASKKLFKEKTAAYKVLAATEKVLHLTRLAMDAKELFMKLKTTAASTAATTAGQAAETAATGAGFFARIGIYISEIFAKFTAMLGPFGPPLAVAAIAAIGLSAFGRKGGSGNFMPTAEQRQQTQGTAMGYNAQGQQVQVRRGVFGDTEAKSQSIDNSLKLIKENSVDGLSYQNKMLLALEGIKKSLEGTAKGLYRIAGLRTGTAFGTQTGTQSSGTDLLGLAFFKKTTTKEIVDSGIQVKGSFLDLANGIRGTIQIFETVQTTLKKSGFLGIGSKTTTTRDTIFTDLFGIDPKAAENISKAFDYGRDLLVSTAEFAGISETAVNEILGTVRLEEFASLRGLKGEDFAKELQAVLGSILDDAALAIFATFKDYERFGEGMLETVIRVTDTNKKVIQAIKNTGFSQLATGSGTFAITEALVDSAGGLDTLLSSLETFRQNFLTETAQLLPIQESVTEELNRLGLGFVKTKEQFAKELISLDIIASETDRSTFTSLLKIQDNFLKVTKAAEETSEKQQQEAEALNKRLLELQGQTQVLREKELAAISETNRVLQERIYALEDLKTTEQNLATAQDKVKSIQDRATDAYIQASQKVADAQQNIANQAIEAAKKMRDFAKTLREFIQQQVSVNNPQFGVQQFQQAVQQALGGDQQSLANIQQLAESAIESARATSRSSREFEATRRQVLSSVIEVAKFAEAQAALVQIPEEDPQKQAQKALEDALAVQQQALLVAQATSAALVKLPENLVEQYLVAKQQLNEAILARINAESAATRLELTFTAISEDIRKLVQVNETGLGIVETNTGTTASNTANLRVTLDDMMRGVTESVELSIKNSQPITRGYGFDVAGPPSPYSMIYNQMVGNLGGEQADSLARKLAEDPVLRKSVLGWSMGGVFGTTMRKYAQGGAFTNQVVDRPTGFNLGVMGEAGPEAIMPLTRIGGRLGVTAELPQFTQPQQSNAELLEEIIRLRKEVENLRIEARATAVSSNKTYRLFDRITTNGEALNVVTIS